MIHGTFSVADKDVRKHKQMFMPSAENQCIIGGSVLSTFFFFFLNIRLKTAFSYIINIIQRRIITLQLRWSNLWSRSFNLLWILPMRGPTEEVTVIGAILKNKKTKKERVKTLVYDLSRSFAQSSFLNTKSNVSLS